MYNIEKKVAPTRKGRLRKRCLSGIGGPTQAVSSLPEEGHNSANSF